MFHTRQWFSPVVYHLDKTGALPWGIWSTHWDNDRGRCFDITRPKCKMTDSSSLNYVYTKECPWPWFFSWPSWTLMPMHPNTSSWTSAEPLAAAIGFLREARPRDGMWISESWKWNISGQETMSEAGQGCCKLPELPLILQQDSTFLMTKLQLPWIFSTTLTFLGVELFEILLWA